MRALVALALLLTATSANAADQFDLICKGRSSTTHFRVDLASREWCWENCSGTWRIAEVTASRITFKDERSGPSQAYNSVSRATGQWFMSARGIYGFIHDDGICTPAPFSGFPAAKF